VTIDMTQAAGSMAGLATMTRATFAPHLGEGFTLAVADTRVPLTLAAVDALPPLTGAGRREPFSLVFRGPRHQGYPQGTYAVDHPELGRLDVFLVPIEPDAQGARYEAVFT
jgi:hypothetical protein